MKTPNNILFTGKLNTAVDGTTLQQGDFQVLKNMRYGENYPRSIAGMTKINSTATPEIDIKNGFHFKKSNESHVLVWANGKVYKNDTAIPNAGAFTVSSIQTDSTGFSTGRFAIAPDGAMIYCNGVETKIWGGDEFRCASFFVGSYTNYTVEISNSLTSDYATISSLTLYIAATRPISSMKFYIGTANTTANTATVKYWNGSAWTAVTGFSDGTSSGGKSLAQTGIMSFDTTESIAKAKVEFSSLAYWYQITLSAIYASTTVYQITLGSPVETLKDIWNGILNDSSQFFNYNAGWQDLTNNVKFNDYIDSATQTYVDISNFATTGILAVGFTSQQTGLLVKIAPAYGNTNASVLTIKYWNGTAFTAVTITDNTISTAGATLGKTGYILWQAPADEHIVTIDGTSFLYFYEFTVSATLDATVRIDQIQGISAQQNPKDYAFPVYWNNRVGLCNNTSQDKNKILLSATDTNCVFNGYDSAVLYFGDNTDLLAATELYIRDTSIFSNLLVLKQNEIWLIDGTVPSNFVLYNISKTHGITAPLTLKACGIGFTGTGLIPKHIAIWQANGAIILFDGSTISVLSDDIKNLFDANSSDHINFSYTNISSAFFDSTFNEYHWLFADSTSSTINREMVYDIIKKKWYEVDRGTGKKLQCGIPVIDTLGNSYIYGGIATGYVERLEYGTTFDGNNIVSTLKTGDIAFKDWGHQSLLRNIKLLARVKSNTTSTVSITHFKDMETTGTSIGSASLTSTTKRVIQEKFSISKGDSVFHAFQLQLTTSNETSALEPIGLQAFVEELRDDK